MCAVATLLVTAGITFGQSGSDLDDFDAGAGFAAAAGDADETTPESIRTLDQIRQLQPADPGTMTELYYIPKTTYRLQAPVDRGKTALGKVNELRIKLKSGKDRPKIESELRQALSEYFLADMRRRVQELDDIKARLAKTEAQLQKRLDSQQESIDLQLKLFLSEADGLGFFSSEDALDESAALRTIKVTQPVPGTPGGNPSKPANPNPFFPRNQR